MVAKFILVFMPTFGIIRSVHSINYRLCTPVCIIFHVNINNILLMMVRIEKVTFGSPLSFLIFQNSFDSSVSFWYF